MLNRQISEVLEEEQIYRALTTTRKRDRA